jgi:hypothetical protein
MTLSKHREFIALLAGVAFTPILRALVVPAAIHSKISSDPRSQGGTLRLRTLLTIPNDD